LRSSIGFQEARANSGFFIGEAGQPRSQGFSFEGGRGGKRPWHRLVTCPSYILKSFSRPPTFKGKALGTRLKAGSLEVAESIGQASKILQFENWNPTDNSFTRNSGKPQSRKYNVIPVQGVCLISAKIFTTSFFQVFYVCFSKRGWLATQSTPLDLPLQFIIWKHA